MQHLVGPAVLSHLPGAGHALLTGRSFFPHLISAPFRSGLHAAFAFAIVACLVAAVASWSRGASYVHRESPEREDPSACPGAREVEHAESAV